jgi:hypothetical protein
MCVRPFPICHQATFGLAAEARVVEKVNRNGSFIRRCRSGLILSMSSSYKRVTLYVPTGTLKLVDDIARKETRSRSEQVTHALKSWLTTSAPTHSEEPPHAKTG